MKNCVEMKRREHGLTRAQLAEALGVSYETVYRWEMHNMPMTNESLLKLAAYFQVTPAEIIPAFGVVPSEEQTPTPA